MLHRLWNVRSYVMLEYKRILDYIIEQADRNDARCLQFEQDIIFRIAQEVLEVLKLCKLQNPNTELSSCVWIFLFLSDCCYRFCSLCL